MSERKRNKFVVSKALINFVFAAVLTAAATQLAHTADSMNYTFDRSVSYQGDDVYAALNDMHNFMEMMNVKRDTMFDIDLCCEELMTNIAKHSTGHITEHSFDVHMCINNEGIFVTLKDAGKPFDPIKAGKMKDENIGKPDHQHLGLRLVNNIIPDITYKYMYGQNTVFIHKTKEEKGLS